MLAEVDLDLESLTAALVVATLLLALISFFNTIATRKLARISDREFCATKLPIVALKWTYRGYGQSPEEHHIAFCAEFQKLNGVPISALAAAQLLRVSFFPTYVLSDERGRILARSNDLEELRPWIDEALTSKEG